ncbi:Protein of unknown function [Gryllus bimaculatus]|nr:Protein of unknown function [Gryllus bimaculatus]
MRQVAEFSAALPYRERLRDEVTLARRALGAVPRRSSARWAPALPVDVSLAEDSTLLTVQLPVTLWRADVADDDGQGDEDYDGDSDYI